MTITASEIDALRNLTTRELTQRYLEVWGKPPYRRHRAWLVKRIAWKLEEQRCGGLSQVAKRNLEKLIADIELPRAERTRTGRLTDDSKSKLPPIGTTLVRQFKGKEYRVTIRENGVEHDGTLYRSLTAVAQAITGSDWSGPLFFNLTPRSKKATR